MDVVAPPETVKAELIRLECNEGWHWNQVRSEAERCSEQSKSTNRKPGGKLNPTFVEFLMGFPENWTKIEQAESKVSETQSSPKWQESSDSQSKKFYPTPRNT